MRKMQPHPHGEIQVADQRQQLSGGVLSLEHHRPVGVGHLRDDRVRVLRILAARLEGHEHEVRVEAIDHVVGRVGEQGMILFVVDVRSGRARLAHRDADEPGARALAQPLMRERVARKRLGLQQERRIRGDLDLRP
jgi:hypothetical protein